VQAERVRGYPRRVRDPTVRFAASSAFSLLALAGSACKEPPAPQPSAPVVIDAGPAQLAAKDMSPPKKPPPLKARAPIPQLPDLPALAAHEAPAQAPPAAVSTPRSPCKSVWTGSQLAPLACAKALLFGAKHAAAGAAAAVTGGVDPSSGGATALVPRALLARDPSVLPPMVDHRVEGTEGPTRNQGTAPACTAFATATAIDHALIRWSGKTSSASAMQIWSRYHSPSVETSLLSNIGQPIGPEQAWPFNVTQAVSWVPCSDMPAGSKAKCGLPVNDPHADKIAAASVGEFTEVEYLTTPLDTKTLETKLAAGQDIIVGMELPTAFVPKGKPGARYIPDYSTSAGPDAGHAFVLAGYAQMPHGTYFLAHNSWGPSWGDGGYAWIHESTIGKWVHDAVAVDAEPLDRDDASRPRKDRWTKECPDGLLPDSIRAACSPACPDGSPRHDDVCAVDGQCPTSYVNLSGSCVLAAPVAKGSDPKTNISWTCGPGGCAYHIPRASDPECSGSVCDAACPAPDFHVARMGSTLVCIE
jgi:hypothetical protein